MVRSMAPSESSINIRPVQASDREMWQPLFEGYREFYRLTPNAAVVDRVWGWVTDDDHDVRGLVAELDGDVVGIAHYRRFARPSSGTVGLWLDDLFVDPQCRGNGVAGHLIGELQRLADADGLSVVRWITAQDNDRARALYDQVATATHWVVYDAQPGADTAQA